VLGNTEICNEDYIIQLIKNNGFIFDAVIISGGEFLLNDLNEIVTFLSDARKIYNGVLIINTNGTFPDKIKRLSDSMLIDGFHTDLKFPINIENPLLAEQSTGIKNVKLNDIIRSLEYTIQFDRGYSQIRSVKYPFVDDNMIALNKLYLSDLNNRFKKQTPYYVNEFIKVGD
jgi:organic radical activating enzyme